MKMRAERPSDQAYGIPMRRYEELDAKRIKQKLPQNPFNSAGFTMNKPTLPSSRSDSGFVRGQTCCPIVELRQYILHPGSRDVLIDLFDREFIESQEAVGMRIMGQFREFDDPNRFVWFSHFRDQAAHDRDVAGLAQSPHWGGEISDELARRLKGHPEVLKLSPTARSLRRD